MSGGSTPRVGAEVAPSPPVGAEGSVRTLLDAAASALTRANEELQGLNELLQRVREVGGRQGPGR